MPSSGEILNQKLHLPMVSASTITNIAAANVIKLPNTYFWQKKNICKFRRRIKCISLNKKKYFGVLFDVLNQGILYSGTSNKWMIWVIKRKNYCTVCKLRFPGQSCFYFSNLCQFSLFRAFKRGTYTTPTPFWIH